MTPPDRRQLRFKDKLFFVFLAAVLTAGGFFVARLYAAVDKKLDAEIYYRDMAIYDAKQKERYDTQDKKSDLIIRLLQDHTNKRQRDDR